MLGVLCIFPALYMIDWNYGNNCGCSVSLWQANDGPVRVRSERAICGSWWRAATQIAWQSSGISLSMARDDSVVGRCDTPLGYCYRWMSLMRPTRRLSPSPCTFERAPQRRPGRLTHPEPTHSQWACHWENTPWLKKAQLWLPLHGWCGLMMAHPWPGDENLMNCQEANSFKWEIDRQELHMGQIIDASGCLDICLQVVIWWPSLCHL